MLGRVRVRDAEELAVFSIAHCDLCLCLLRQHRLQMTRVRLQDALNELQALPQLLVLNIQLSVLRILVV